MNEHRFNLVIPDDLWKTIKALAENNHRSVTREILVAIENNIALQADIKTIGIWIPATKEQLIDVIKLRSLINEQFTDISAQEFTSQIHDDPIFMTTLRAILKLLASSMPKELPEKE